MIFRTGTQNRTRYIDLTSIANKLGPDVCAVLPGYHAFSGSDSRGKVIGYKLIKDNDKFRQTMIDIGQSFDVTTELITSCETAICSMYGKKQTCVNQLRHDMFGGQTTDPCRLPPCKNAAHYHIRRANYQAAIWRRCLENRPNIPSPHGHGWEVKDDQITLTWIDISCAPTSVLESVSCKCQQFCEGRCSCRRNHLKCNGTGACEKILNHLHKTYPPIL